jgi:hypothetical protein
VCAWRGVCPGCPALLGNPPFSPPRPLSYPFLPLPPNRLLIDDPTAPPTAGAIAGATFTSLLTLGVSSAALWYQYRAVFDVIVSGGRIPERLTWALEWWPERVRAWWLRRGGEPAHYDPNEEGYRPLSAGAEASARAPPPAMAWAASGAPLPPPPGIGGAPSGGGLV